MSQESKKVYRYDVEIRTKYVVDKRAKEIRKRLAKRRRLANERNRNNNESKEG